MFSCARNARVVWYIILIQLRCLARCNGQMVSVLDRGVLVGVLVKVIAFCFLARPFTLTANLILGLPAYYPIRGRRNTPNRLFEIDYRYILPDCNGRQRSDGRSGPLGPTQYLFTHPVYSGRLKNLRRRGTHQMNCTPDLLIQL